MVGSSALRHSLSLAASWGCAALILVAGYVYQAELRAIGGTLLGLPELRDQLASLERAQATGEGEPSPAGTVELRAGRNGHFDTEAQINGRSVQVMVDTGASLVALTWEDAQAAGIYVSDADFKGQVRTANGTAFVAPVMIDKLSIGDITVLGVRGVVSRPGALSTTLLGMSFLGRLTRAEMRKGTLILEQ